MAYLCFLILNYNLSIESFDDSLSSFILNQLVLIINLIFKLFKWCCTRIKLPWYLRLRIHLNINLHPQILKLLGNS